MKKLWLTIILLYVAVTLSGCAALPWDYGVDKQKYNHIADCYIPSKDLKHAKIIEVIDNGY